jgi:hypothetical protein
MAISTGFDLVRNGSVAIFTSTKFSTHGGSTDGWPGTLVAASSYVNIPIPQDDILGILLTYAASTVSTSPGPQVTVSAGSGWRSALGSKTFSVTTTSTVQCVRQHFIGPFESGQFQLIATNTSHANKVGDPYLNLAVSTSTSAEGARVNTVWVCPFKFPKVDYTT